jgi:hypothetical protein
MRFSIWLPKRQRSASGTPGRARKSLIKRPTFRPRLEALEDRCVPSTLKVTNLDDFGNPGSLRYEIAQANSGDTIAFDKNLAGVITLTGAGDLVISKSLTIKGPGQYQLTLTSQYYTDNLFDFLPGSRLIEVDGAGTTVAISGLTFTGGGGTVYGGVSGQPYDGYGGAILNFGTLTLSSCTLGGSNFGVEVQYNSAEYGGAIANFGTMTVSGCDVHNNFAEYDGEGGGIYNAGTLTVSGCDVQYNSVFGDDIGGKGGGIYNAGTLTVSNSNVVGNVASGTDYGTAAEGGGIYNAGTASALTVVRSIFSNNSPNNIFGPYTDGGHNKFK